MGIKIDYRNVLKTLLTDSTRVLAEGFQSILPEWQDQVRADGLAAQLTGYVGKAATKSPAVRAEILAEVSENIAHIIEQNRLLVTKESQARAKQLFEVFHRTFFAVADKFTGGLAGALMAAADGILANAPAPEGDAPAA